MHTTSDCHLNLKTVLERTHPEVTVWALVTTHPQEPNCKQFVKQCHTQINIYPNPHDVPVCSWTKAIVHEPTYSNAQLSPNMPKSSQLFSSWLQELNFWAWAELQTACLGQKLILSTERTHLNCLRMLELDPVTPSSTEIRAVWNPRELCNH